MIGPGNIPIGDGLEEIVATILDVLTPEEYEKAPGLSEDEIKGALEKGRQDFFKVSRWLKRKKL